MRVNRHAQRRQEGNEQAVTKGASNAALMPPSLRYQRHLYCAAEEVRNGPGRIRAMAAICALMTPETQDAANEGAQEADV